MNKEYMGGKWLQRAFLIAVADILTVLISYFAALVLRFDLRPWNIPSEYLGGYCWSMPYWVAVTIVVFYGCRLYHSIWRLASLAEFQSIVAAYALLVFAYLGGALFMNLHMPVSYYLMGVVLNFCMTTGIRFSYRFVRFYISRRRIMPISA